jgi:hypothetical protein
MSLFFDIPGSPVKRHTIMQLVTCQPFIIVVFIVNVQSSSAETSQRAPHSSHLTVNSAASAGLPGLLGQTQLQRLRAVQRKGRHANACA